MYLVSTIRAKLRIEILLEDYSLASFWRICSKQRRGRSSNTCHYGWI